MASSEFVAYGRSPAANSTPIGVDAGLKNLAVAAPAEAGPLVEDALVVDGDRVRELWAEAQEVVPEFGYADHYRALFRGEFASAAADVVGYAREFPSPTLAIEDLNHASQRLEAALQAGGDGHLWILPAFLDELVDAAAATGVPVVQVDPKYTTRACHACQQFASVRDGVIECPTEGCPVGVVCRDRSAAVSIANRL